MANSFVRPLILLQSLTLLSVGPTLNGASPPAIASLSVYPAAVSAGSALSFHLYGSGFLSGAVVYLGTTPLPTVFGDPTDLQVSLAAAVTATAATSYTAQLTVHNPDASVSNSFNFDIKKGPVLTSLSVYPPSVSAGSALAFHAYGTGFLPSSIAYLGSTALPTTFGDPTDLQVSMPASATVGATASYTTTITVHNPDGTVSNGVSFDVRVGPVITSLSQYPASVSAGSPVSLQV